MDWDPLGSELDPGMGGGRIQGTLLTIPCSSVGKPVSHKPQVLGLISRSVIVDMFCIIFEPTVPFCQLLRLQATSNFWNQSLEDIPVTKRK